MLTVYYIKHTYENVLIKGISANFVHFSSRNIGECDILPFCKTEYIHFLILTSIA